jgi:hypothetical protein
MRTHDISYDDYTQTTPLSMPLDPLTGADDTPHLTKVQALAV